MASRIKTYNPKEVIITLGTHIVNGIADDSFVSIEQNGDGITKKVGCDGEIVRSISPDNTYNIKIALLQTSETNTFLQKRVAMDQTNGSGMFPILIHDLKGGLQFSSDAAWVAKAAPRGYGKEASNREWDIQTAGAELSE